ncbi:MAG: DNA topoisomerase IV subunit A [Parachlamydiales bacterium]
MADDLKGVMEENYLQYASYVILDRAIPNVVDGLKPVQRRILYTLKKIDDGKLHKVANVAGQTMAFHPHGDAAIIDALVNLANKETVLDRQGNFGNLYTGDPAAAARYIETRLTPLARETLFNKELTSFIPSYDGRNEEPVTLPAKIPLLLMHGAEGIAVGMSTRILPHNFVELLEAQIAILEGTPFTLLPDFPTGGILDASEYDKGKGKVKLRARLKFPDDKTIKITEICYGTTTESLIRSVDEAAKRGKIKIDSIHDYTADKVEIEITLPRGQYADEVAEALYAFTECEVSLNSIPLVIKDNLPWETDVDQILRLNTDNLQATIKGELELERDRLIAKIFDRTLEQIFIENRLYKKIEEIASYEKIHETIKKSLEPFHKELSRLPTFDDRERLLQIPIRKISRFDIEKNQEEIASLREALARVEKDLKTIKKCTIAYLRELIKKFGAHYKRKTEIKEIEALDLRAIQTKKVKVGYDAEKGFLGTKVSAETTFECTNFDKVLVLYGDGTYTVKNLPEKEYVAKEGTKVVYVGAADKVSTFSAVYRDGGKIPYAKRFVIDKWILDRSYEFLPEGSTLDYLTTDPHPVVTLDFVPKARLKQKTMEFALDEVGVKGVKAKGNRIANKETQRVRKRNGG